MSDLDKVIRDAAQNANWFGLSAAITAVLNLHGHEIADGFWHRDGTPALRCLGCDTVIMHKSNLCATRRELARELGVSGDRSEPTPVRREPRVWQEDDPDPAKEGLVVRDVDGDEATYSEGGWCWTLIDGVRANGPWGPWEWPIADMNYPATEVLPEVVTPEGPA